MSPKYKILTIVLALITILLIIDKFFSRKKYVEIRHVYEQTYNEKDSLINELQDMYFAYTKIETKNKELQDSLNAQKQKIENLLKEIRTIKSTDQAKIKELKEEISLLKEIMKSYIRQIDSLYTQNQALIAENKEIKQQYTIAKQQVEQLNQVTDSLKSTVQIAQKVTAYNISINTLGDRDKPTNRIKKIKKFEICFLLSENLVVSKGRKYLYLRIAKPDGEIIINDKSGYFTYENKTIAYSSVKEIEYDGRAQETCMYFFNPYEDLPAGKYTIFLFMDGKEIGSQDIILK